MKIVINDNDYHYSFKKYKGREIHMKKWKLVSVLIAMFLVLAACGSNGDSTSEEPKEEQN